MRKLSITTRNMGRCTELRSNRMVREAGNFYIPAEPKLAFVIRMRGIKGENPKVQGLWNHKWHGGTQT